MKKFLIIFFLVVLIPSGYAQYNVGTTGLLNMPTADMQRDKTIMIGGSYLEKHTSPGRWYYDTFNYYFNVTFFPWLEIAYDLTLFKALPNDGHWVRRTYGKFVNQDRNFAIRVRVWKEGDWKWWMPQIVIGGNDAVNSSFRKNHIIKPLNWSGNGYYNRYYLAMTKHIELDGFGQVGAHISYVYNDRIDNLINAPAFGANVKFNMVDIEEEMTWQKVLNGLDLMIEFYPANNHGMYYYEQKIGKKPGRGLHLGIWDVNMGGSYSFLGDRINLYGEFYGCRYFSGGLMFKLHLK